MLHAISTKEQSKTGLGSYIIRGGKEGAERLNVLSRTLGPSTSAFLDRLGPLDGLTIIDAGSGGGNVTIELARRVGPKGRVIGFDLDAEKLAVAEDSARQAGLANCQFIRTDVTAPWPVDKADMVYARFVLTHLREPDKALGHAKQTLVPGGTLAIEDIDTDGCFHYPPSDEMNRFRALYIATGRHNGVDPMIGRRLDLLLEQHGFHDVQTALVQPFGRSGDAKMTVVFTFHAIADSVVAAGLASRAEVDRLRREIDVYAAREDTKISMPRVFQARGIKP